MKATFSREAFHEATQLVLGSIDPRSVKPILQDIRIQTVEGKLELAGTDLEVGIKVILPEVTIEEEGGLVVPGARLASIVRESPDEKLHISITEKNCRIEGGDSSFRMIGEALDEFPEIPDFEGDPQVEIGGSVLKEMARKTVIATALEKGRYALHGVLLVLKKDSSRVEMVATDGRRLAHIRRKAASESKEDTSAIIPPKAVHQIERMVSDETGPVAIMVDDRRIYVQTENAKLVAQLVEGRFPTYDDVIPKESDKKASVGREAFLSGVRRAALLTGEESRAIHMTFDANRLTMEGSAPEAGEARVELDVRYEGAPVKISLNADFLVDWLRVVDDEEVRIEMTGPQKPCVLKAGQGCLYVVMPITGL